MRPWADTSWWICDAYRSRKNDVRDLSLYVSGSSPTRTWVAFSASAGVDVTSARSCAAAAFLSWTSRSSWQRMSSRSASSRSACRFSSSVSVRSRSSAAAASQIAVIASPVSARFSTSLSSRSMRISWFVRVWAPWVSLGCRHDRRRAARRRASLSHTGATGWGTNAAAGLPCPAPRSGGRGAARCRGGQRRRCRCRRVPR